MGAVLQSTRLAPTIARFKTSVNLLSNLLSAVYHFFQILSTITKVCLFSTKLKKKTIAKCQMNEWQKDISPYTILQRNCTIILLLRSIQQKNQKTFIQFHSKCSIQLPYSPVNSVTSNKHTRYEHTVIHHQKHLTLLLEY